MTSYFLNHKAGMRRLLIAKHPVILIDESQDTVASFMDALLAVQAASSQQMCLGLFGDTMQRIYNDGKVGLGDLIPADWETPRKVMNHRCPQRVVALINRIRADDDKQEQRARSDAAKGTVRLFLAHESSANKKLVEDKAAEAMAELTGDPLWMPERGSIKMLALEHLMAARRFGFESFFEPLYRYESMRTGLLDGTGRGLGFFTRELLPLSLALVANDRFGTAASLRKTSPLLDRNRLALSGLKQNEMLKRAKVAADGLKALLSAQDAEPSLRDVLRYASEHELFIVPEVLLPFTAGDTEIDGDESVEDDEKTEAGAWRRALDAPFSAIEKYDRYVRGVSQFDTHQGVKGREFPRVMVVLSDEESRGFLFSYDKLMGNKEKSKADLENEASGGDTSIARTRRLFYVTCSRAEESLAVVYYSENPSQAKANMQERGWFDADEMEIIGT